jgi:hypothetical protein
MLTTSTNVAVAKIRLRLAKRSVVIEQSFYA